jgi:ankyrin repeat protein
MHGVTRLIEQHNIYFHNIIDIRYYYATMTSNLFRVKTMADRNAELLNAVDANDLECVKATFHKKEGFWNDTEAADVNIGWANSGNTSLIIAASKGYRTIVQFLFSKGAKVSLPNKSGQTPLMFAAKGGFKVIMADLIEKGAQVTEKDNDGVTVLMYAAYNKQGMAVKFLLEIEQDVNETDNNGLTAAMYAARRGDDVSLQLLLNKEASPDMQDNEGNTAMMWAIKNNCLNTLETLLKRGAKTDIRDNQGRTIFDLSTNDEIKNLLKEYADKKAGLGMRDALIEAFKKEGLDPEMAEQWTPIGDVAIDCIAASIQSPKVLSTIFNFESRQYLVTVKNVLTGEKSENSGELESFPNQELVKKAYKKLQEMGKNPPLLKNFPL